MQQANQTVADFWKALGVFRDPKTKLEVGNVWSVDLPTMDDRLPAIGVGSRYASVFSDPDGTNSRRGFIEIHALSPGGTMLELIRWVAGPFSVAFTFSQGINDTELNPAAIFNDDTGFDVYPHGARDFPRQNGVRRGHFNAGAGDQVVGLTTQHAGSNGTTVSFDLSRWYIPRGFRYQLENSFNGGINYTIEWTELQEPIA